MANGSATSGLRSTWEMAAPGWAKWEHVFATSFSEATDALIEMTGIEPGMRVLDIACGAGSQSIRAAMRTGPEGRVVASDISATMLEHVRRNARRSGVENIETIETAAEELDESLAPFDAAICRMALMLFPSPPGALQAVRRILRPGARFGALVFTTPDKNPFLAQPMAILRRHAGKAAPAPGSPGIFALGADGILEGLMTEAGFKDLSTKIVRARLALASARDALQLMQEAAGAYRAVVADLDDEARSKAWDDVHECLKRFDSGSGFETELEAIICSGVSPG